MEGRAILAPTNKEVNAINELMKDWLPGENIILSSAETQHKLSLRKGMLLMLLRNINPQQGLCNGTRLIFDSCIDNKLLQCRIVESGRVVLIPRITFIPKINEYPFLWKRRQFPVRSAFAVMINKSQGQSLKKAGVWFRGQVMQIIIMLVHSNLLYCRYLLMVTSM